MKANEGIDLPNEYLCKKILNVARKMKQTNSLWLHPCKTKKHAVF